MISWASGSQLSVSGPAAGLTVIVFTAIEQLGSFGGFLVSVVLAGVIQLFLGYLRAGIIGLQVHGGAKAKVYYKDITIEELAK